MKIELKRYNFGQYWYLNKQYYRSNGPAYEGTGGSKEWWSKDKLKRLDGPQHEYNDGSRAEYK